jgi:hypothetical protein
MCPWFTMPSGADAARQAAVMELRNSLTAIECAARLLGSAVPARERPLVAALRTELQHALRAARRVAGDRAIRPSRSLP